jgi:hypothetical protein
VDAKFLLQGHTHSTAHSTPGTSECVCGGRWAWLGRTSKTQRTLLLPPVSGTRGFRRAARAANSAPCQGVSTSLCVCVLARLALSSPALPPSPVSHSTALFCMLCIVKTGVLASPQAAAVRVVSFHLSAQRWQRACQPTKASPRQL